MATYYWVGGTGTWNTSTTTNWASSSNGAGGAGVPTSADDVIIDSSSGTGTITCTAGVCNNLTVTATQAIILGAASSTLSVFGSLTFPSGGSFSASTNSNIITFASTTTGKIITTNGKSLSGAIFNGVGGEWTLGSALTLVRTTTPLTLTNGTLDTSSSGNYALTSGVSGGVNGIQLGSGTKALNLNASSVTLPTNSPIDFTTNVTGFTLNAGTSTITCSMLSSTTSAFNSTGLTYYNLVFTRTTSTTITFSGGNNTFNNLTFPSLTADGICNFILSGNITVNDTLTLGTSNTAVRRLFFRSDSLGTVRTITATTVATLSDVDFRDISFNSPQSGTRLGDCGGNANITFDAAKTVYWNLTGSQSWSAVAWATSSGGIPAVNNFPLAQDTAIFNDDGTATSVSNSSGQTWNIGTIDMSTRTTAFTFAMNSNTNHYGSITFFSNLTLTGTGTIFFVGRGNTQIITSGGKTFGNIIFINNVGGTVRLNDALTTTNSLSLNYGIFNANGYNVTISSLTTSISTTRTLTMGGGLWTLTGTGAVWSAATITGLTFNKDTSNILLSDNSTTARTFAGGGLTYNKLTIGGATGTSATTINGNNTFAEIDSTKTVAHTVTFSSNGITFDTWSVKGTAFPVSGFQNILSNSAYSIAQADVDGYRMNYLVAPDISISGTTPRYVADNSSINTTNMILVFRPNTTPSSVTVNSLNNYADAGVLTSPANQTITSGSGTAPLVALALYEQVGGGTITTRSFSPAEDGEVTSGTSRYIKYKIYNSSPSDITVGMTSSSGTARGLSSYYLQFNGTSSVSFVASSTNGVVPTVQAGDIVVSFIVAGDASSSTPILVPVSPSNGVAVNSSTAGSTRTINITNKTVDIDYLSVRDITSSNLNPVTFYAGVNSTNNGNNTGVAFIERTTASPQNAHILTSGTTFTVPSDWNSSNNNIYMIGAGGGGRTSVVSGDNRAAGSGGGGGAFTQLTNFTATPSSSVAYAIGTSAFQANGGNTTWDSGTYIANGGLTGTTTATPTSTGGAGGTAQIVSGIITAAFAGGNGGAGAFGTAASTGYGSGAGGGAGGPNGVGGNGGTGFGSSTAANIAGGGGGANGGGSNGGNAASATFGSGGNNFSGIGGGTTSNAAGTFGGGGAGVVNTGNGGGGGSGIDILNTLGGGGGKGGTVATSSINTGLYGAGGGGGGVTTAGGAGSGSAGSQGVIFIVYTPITIVVTTGFGFRLANTGILYVPTTSQFDEVTQSTIGVKPTAFYAEEFDEVTNPGVPARYLNNGIVQTQSIIDEITGIS